MVPAGHHTEGGVSMPENAEVIVLGAGCFWCTEAVFQRLPGVLRVTSGYAGGTEPKPTYERICSGKSDHVEVSQVVYDRKKTSLENLLEAFFLMHDPTSRDRQGNDTGPQYRSAIFYQKDDQLPAIEGSIKKAAPQYAKDIVTEVRKCTVFHPAEAYHQNFYNANSRNPYCSAIIAPKLRKLML